MKEKIAIGKILKPHGIRGDFIFLSYSGTFAQSHYPHLFLFYKQEYKPITLSKVKPYKSSKKQFLVQLENIDRNFLDFVRGAEIFIEDLPYETLQEDEFFYRDLEDCEVFYGEKFLGKVISVHNFSGPDLVEVEYFDEGKQKSRNVFLPVKEPFLISMDIANKKLVFEAVDDFL